MATAAAARRIGCLRPSKRLSIACKLCHDPKMPVVRFNLAVAGKDPTTGRWTTRSAGSTVLCSNCLRILSVPLQPRRRPDG